MDQLVVKTATSKPIDWSKCILCQSNTKKTLNCPANSKRQDAGAGYETIANTLVEFNALQALPFDIDLDVMKENDSLESSLRTHKASWHTSCYSKINTTKLKRLKGKKRQGSNERNNHSPKKIYTRHSGSCDAAVHESTIPVCFFCGNGDHGGILHEVTTFKLDQRVRKCAHDLKDQELIAKLASNADLIAQEAKYHGKCLAQLYRNASKIRTQQYDDLTSNRSIALAELISYLEDCRRYTDIRSFRLADIVKLYKERLHQLGEDAPERIHSTHLKNRILWHLPELKAYNKGRDVFLAFSEDVGSLLSTEYFEDSDEQNVMMVKLAKIIREDIFSKTNTFNGTFDHESQVNSVPQSLLTLINMILNGSNITEQTHTKSISQPVLSIAQLVTFNTVKQRRRTGDTSKIYHRKERQTPVPLYIGLKVHSLSRDHELIDSLYSLGISVSYNNVMDTITAMGNNVLDYYNEINVVCPPQLQNGLFVTAAADNIDHNPSSTTSTDSFHGTGLSLFQNKEADDISENTNCNFNKQINVVKDKRSVADLPVSYTTIKPTSLPTGDVYIPASLDTSNLENNFVTTNESENQITSAEFKWLQHVKQSHTNEITKHTTLSWASYHAHHNTDLTVTPSVNAMLPLFPDESSSPAMLRHCLDVIQEAVQHINPGQVPVVNVDQPLFAKMKQIQWAMPELYGEDKFVVMLGGFHSEWTLYKALGHWLEGSGWVEALVQADVASSGTAESFLKATHVLKTRNAHQVTAGALYVLLTAAYNDYLSNYLEDDEPMDFNGWILLQRRDNPQFLYWFITLELELLALAFVRSLRTGDFQMYLDILPHIVPWFFSLNHTHYARWMSVHLTDMVSLESKHPDVAAEFKKGKFTMSNSQRSFSRLAIDQGHEQNNAVMKGDGGIIGLTQDTGSLLRWALAGPEIVRVISEFEATFVRNASRSMPPTCHHDQNKATQQRFANQLKSMISTLSNMGNPFDSGSTDLSRLHNRDVMNELSVDCLRGIKQKGKEQFGTFVKERLMAKTKPITDTIGRNTVILFNVQNIKAKSKQHATMSLLKEESSLFSRLYVSCQKRDGNLDSFFSHENQPYPPSLSSFGKLRQGNKSDLLGCLEKLSPD